MKMLVRVQFEIDAADEDACHDKLADLTYDMRSDRDVSGYVEEIVDLD